MKKALIALILLVFLLPVETYCQLNKGSWFGSFSANLGFNHNKYEEEYGWNTITNTINFSIIDNLGFFVANHLAIGPGISFNMQYDQMKDEYTSSSSATVKSTIYSVAFSPFIRYYFAKAGKVAYFVQANPSIGYGQDIYKTSNDKSTRSTISYGGGVGIGLVYFILDNIGLETLLSYNYTGNSIKLDDEKDKSANSAIGIGLGLSFYFGESEKQDNTGDQKK
jgi:hypothetical protein